MDSSERTPTAEFSYHTTPTHSPVYTPSKIGTSTAPPESATYDTFDDTSAIPLEEIVPPSGLPLDQDDHTTAPDIPESSGPTPQDPSDNRSDIFMDISDDDSRTKPVRYPSPDDFNIGLDIDPDLDIDLDFVDYQYDTAVDVPNSVDDSDTLLARKTESFDFVLEVDQEDAKEEAEVSEETTPSVLDRMPFFKGFMDAMIEYGSVKRLNNYLHKKMADYFKKRKMDHVLEEVAHPEEAIIKYGKKLDNFNTLKQTDAIQRKERTAEVMLLREVEQRQCAQAEEVFQQLIDKETEIGIGLISAKTGKEISLKVVERLMAAQITKSDELRDLRLLHITIRNAVTDKHNAIKAMDRIGENYTLIEFEQLKIENQSNMDKIEDRDDELMRLRKKCQNAIQSLAHVREKCSACEQTIRILKQELLEKENSKTMVREQVNRLKQNRDYYRLEAQRLKDDNGLLTKDRLLIDMEHAMQAIIDLEEVIETKRTNLKIGKERVINLRGHYENELRRRIKMERFSPKTPNASTTIRESHKKRKIVKPNKYLGDRPSNLLPTLTCMKKYGTTMRPSKTRDSC